VIGQRLPGVNLWLPIGLVVLLVMIALLLERRRVIRDGREKHSKRLDHMTGRTPALQPNEVDAPPPSSLTKPSGPFAPPASTTAEPPRSTGH
ncbi:MAG: hypothetical protein ACRC1K_11220, partial [Planctomycetia bacterium]